MYCEVGKEEQRGIHLVWNRVAVTHILVLSFSLVLKQLDITIDAESLKLIHLSQKLVTLLVNPRARTPDPSLPLFNNICK